ncbi:MAG: glycosyltransferase family 4 protein [Candidatus Paceibacterota bacterium]
MKVALVIFNFSESRGGVERYVYDLSRCLVRDNHEVHIFCHNANISGADEVAKLKFHTVSVSVAGIYTPFKVLSFAANAAQMVKQERFDIIQGFGRTYYQDIYRVGGGCHWEYLKHTHPSMSNPLGRLIQRYNPRNWAIMKLENESFAPGAYKKIICISKQVKAEIQQYYNVPDKDVVIIYNGIDTNRFNPANRVTYRDTLRSRYGLSPDDVTVLYVGSGFERKGLRYAIDAISKISGNTPPKLLVVGRGTIGKHTRLARKLDIANRVIFAGPQSGIEQFYAAADVFLFPTLYEPFGTVCLEAMSTGLPVITSQRAGASEIMSNGIDAFIVDDPTNSVAMAEKLTLLMDPVWRQNMGKAAQLTAGKYSFELNYQQVLNIYEEVSAIRNK